MQQALSEQSADEPIVIGGDITSEDRLLITDRRILDLNGYTLTLQSIEVKKDGDLTIEDSSEDKTGVLKAKSSGSLIYIKDGTVTLNAGKLEGGYYHSVELQGGSLTMNGGKICGATEAGIKIRKSEDGSNSELPLFTFNDGSIEQNNGYGVDVEATGQFVMNGGTIRQNRKTGVINGGTMTMNDGTIDANNGGGIRSTKTLVIKSGKITNNKGEYGGGISVSYGTFTMDDGLVEGNEAAWYGGGICLYKGSTYKITNSIIRDNTAESEGGGIYLDPGVSCELDKVTLSGNTGFKGGAMKVGRNAKLLMTNVNITGNTASSGYGGGILLEGEATIQNAQIVDNTSASNGGGILVEREGVLKVSGTVTIKDNYGISNKATVSDNVYFLYTSNAVQVTGKLSDSTMGISTGASFYEGKTWVFTSGLKGKGSISSFTSDQGYGVAVDSNGEAVMKYVAPVKVTGVKLNKSSANVNVGSTLTLTATVQPSNATNKNVTWATGNSKVATVDNKGNVTGRKVGTATITVKTADGSKTAKCTVNVRFTDVPASGKYYSTPVYWAVSKNITNGFTDEDGLARTFGPEQNCTRAQMVTFLWREAGRPTPKTETNPFKDVEEGKYYYNPVLWAYEKGITKGYVRSDGAYFEPDETCLREHAVTFMYRMAGKPKVKTTKNPFSDIKKSDYYYTPALWAYENGIAKGYGSGTNQTYGPKLDCLREHIVTFLYRYDLIYGK